jgi:hypothetical protein
MAVPPPVVEPEEPSNRWPWIALALGLLVIAVGVGVFLFDRQRSVNITVEGTPTLSAVARAASPGPPPTLVPPTLPPSATLAPTATALPSPTAAPTPTAQPTVSPAPPAPTQAPAAPTPLAAAAQPANPAPGQPAPPANPAPAQPAPPANPAAGQPAPAPAGQPTPPPAGQPAPANPPPTQPAAPTAAPSPTPFAGQVASAGGFGNTRADFDSTYGPPAGETPEHLVVYRKNNMELHVSFGSDPSGRAALLVEMPQPQTNASPFTIQSATAEAHRLLPRDAQPPNPPQEGNDQFVVERYTSQLLAQALPAGANGGQPGQFMVVYVRDPAQQSRISRFIIGPGTDPQALVNQGR